MGTRNLTVVVLGGAFKVAQYGQWDGYPSGQGATALEFCRTMDRAKFTEKVSKAKFATDADNKDIEALRKQLGDKQFFKQHPQWTRDTGAEILGAIMNAPDGILLADQSDFAADSLFCEWAYVIDLDKGTFEVFCGFNKTPLSEGERFAGPKPDDTSKSAGGEQYHPIKLLKSYSLDALPSCEQMVSECEAAEEAVKA